MLDMQEIFDVELKKLIEPKVILLEAIENCLKKVGVQITESQREKLRKDIAEPENVDKLQINITDEQIQLLKPLSERQIQKKVERALAKVFQEAERLVNRKMARLPKAIKESIRDISSLIIKTIKRESDELLLSHQAMEGQFVENLFAVWWRGFYSIRTLGYVGIEIGSRNALEPQNDPNRPDYKREALRKIHARACQVIQEIRVLLENGYADGAYARWRCLHEMAVISGFLTKQDQELAERYLLYEIVENMKNARHQLALDDKMLEDQEIAEEFEILEEGYKAVVMRFGKQFQKGYGWAACVINDSHITFEKIEKLMNYDLMRSDYHLSSTNVHAGPKGDSTRLGLMYNHGSMLLAGPSNIGLEIPGILSARSYCMLTINLLCLEPTIDQLVEVEIIRRLSLDTERKFSNAAKRLKKMGGSTQKSEMA